MTNSKLFSGSICLSDLIDNAKKQHSAFNKGKNGKIYANVAIWLNDEPDQFGNHISVQISSKKELREQEGKIYVGNAKLFEREAPEPLSDNDAEYIPDASDLPF